MIWENCSVPVLLALATTMLLASCGDNPPPESGRDADRPSRPLGLGGLQR